MVAITLLPTRKSARKSARESARLPRSFKTSATLNLLERFPVEIRSMVWHYYLLSHTDYYFLCHESRELPTFAENNFCSKEKKDVDFLVGHVGSAARYPPLWMARLSIYHHSETFVDFWTLAGHHLLFSFVLNTHLDDFAMGIAEMMPKSPVCAINIEIRACRPGWFADIQIENGPDGNVVYTSYHNAQKHLEGFIKAFKKFGKSVKVHTLLNLDQPWQRYDGLRAVTAPLREHPHTVQVTFGDGWGPFGEIHRELSIASVQGLELRPELVAAKEEALRYIDDY